jgi:hypothetical protein
LELFRGRQKVFFLKFFGDFGPKKPKLVLGLSEMLKTEIFTKKMFNLIVKKFASRPANLAPLWSQLGTNSQNLIKRPFSAASAEGGPPTPDNNVANPRTDYDKFIENREKVKGMKEQIMDQIPSLEEPQVLQTIKIYNDYKIIDKDIFSQAEKYYIQRTSQFANKEVIRAGINLTQQGRIPDNLFFFEKKLLSLIAMDENMNIFDELRLTVLITRNMKKIKKMPSTSFCSGFIPAVISKITDKFPQEIKHWAVLACILIAKNPGELPREFLNHLECELTDKNLPMLLEISYLLSINNGYQNLPNSTRSS